ncbi:dihydroorotase [Methylococcus sp. EFPC2]|uniref:dihydroorotase n=1 Tax=Methylococcus sp. EFPC2 TaxID=2812648 RepID=UPI0019689E71|nr:dihydroorotase [Methylococcus sp. EFPC2]QSA99191.1 dihydroorotase [Methylococcus sp. EFPC2]
MQRLALIQPDDWHLHLRDGAALAHVVAHSARQFARAIVMPNLKPPVTTVALALAYRERILAALPAGSGFQPLMTLYLTESTTADDVREAAACPHVHAFKLYPAGATTHSEAGVGGLDKVYPVLEAMEKYDVPLLVHGEVTDPEIDIFDRERIFIDRELAPIVRRFPRLRVVLEHLTTRDGVQFVRAASPQVAATITAHHLLYNRNALLAGGIRPHYYCLPVLKREAHRQALIEAASSGEAKFFLGTDSAPHPKSAKESDCGCAGCYTAHAALELYAEAFESVGRLENLERFASLNGPDFYRLPRNTRTVTLEKSPWTAPAGYAFGADSLTPLRSGESIAWKLLA